MLYPCITAGMAVNDIRTTFQTGNTVIIPPNSVIYKWIDKYTPLASKALSRVITLKLGMSGLQTKRCLNLDGEHSIWFYDIIDRDTRFLFASRVAISRTTNDAEILMEQCRKMCW